MVGNKETESQKHTGLLAILGVLIISIVCLSAAIVVLKNNSSNQRNNEVSTLKCTDEQSLYDTNACIERVLKSKNKAEFAINEYKAAIKSKKEAGDEATSADLIISMTSLLTAKGYCNQAFDALESESIDSYETIHLNRIYSQALDSSKECNDSERTKLYEEKQNAIKDEVKQYVIQS